MVWLHLRRSFLALPGLLPMGVRACWEKNCLRIFFRFAGDANRNEDTMTPTENWRAKGYKGKFIIPLPQPRII